MEKALRQVLSRLSLPYEENLKLETLLTKEDSLRCAEDIYQTLFCGGDAQSIKALLKAVEDERGSLIFSMAYLLRIGWMKGYLEEKQIPSEQLDHAIGAFRDVSGRSFRKYGFYGLNGVYRGFLYSYMLPTRFRLGRLMFEMGTFQESYEVYETCGSYRSYTEEKAEKAEGICILKKGDPVLHVHIPGEGRLLREEVDAAFQDAKCFFSRYFPDFSYRAFVCSSWLLDPNLKKILKSDSNILDFQNRFTIAAIKENTFSLYWHIFDMEDFVPLDALTPKNNFQKRVLAYLRSGNKLYSGKGFIITP